MQLLHPATLLCDHMILSGIPASTYTVPPQLACVAFAENDSSDRAALEDENDLGPPEYTAVNHKFVLRLVYIWIAIIGTIFTYRLVMLYVAHTRKMACLYNDKQNYFTIPTANHSVFKRYILDSPLFRKRHNREFKISTAINVGTLPTRLQTMLLVAYYVINIIFCLVELPYGDNYFTTALGNRTSLIALANMIPLFLMAGRNNILILALDISFDTYNMMHRWLGRLVVLESIAHALTYIVHKVQTEGWKALWNAAGKSTIILTGVISVCAFTFLLLHSPSMVRHAYYEAFLHAHILVAATAVIALWVHLSKFPWGWAHRILLAAVIIWVFERFMRVQNLIRNNVGAGGTLAEVQAMPGNACRVTLHLARPWKFRPGQYVFLYIPSIGWWTNHPFSVAWSDEYRHVHSEQGLAIDSEDSGSEKALSINSEDVLAIRKTSMCLVVRCRTGFTSKLWARAQQNPGGKFITTAFAEGPYGSQDLSSYGTVMLFAAGVGITHQIPFLRSLVADYNNYSGATRRVTLVWVIQSTDHLEWIRPWLTDILEMENRCDVLKILLFITRPRNEKELQSPSSSVQMFPGKPNVEALVAAQQHHQVGAMAVTVCGTGSLSDDVRRAVRMSCHASTIDFIENAFSW
ncbi:hypothetical protein K461DRAFT_307714 [Myriangium duriaei CBS 260.36]|uniref:ferric-chelate reductase (NADPH) n=1 Tax=Myriangium duriaei CBS 260.36 TaxID=1168546 RepID=A0A9P4J253_9PEZI|nr:hypothetical protein K461DRAFT_307714 [Myriangium duriaei CBS 260.36]